jgi:hypothetical protein
MVRGLVGGPHRAKGVPTDAGGALRLAGKSVGSEDVQVADHEPLQGKVVVVVKVKLSAFVPSAVSWTPEGMP